MGRLALAAAGVLLLSTTARSDVLCLTDGRIFEDVLLTVNEESVIIHFENGDAVIPSGRVLDCIVADVSNVTPRNDDERKKFDQGLVPFQGKWIKADKRDKLVERMLEDRHREVAEMKANRLWRNRTKVESKSFDYEYTVAPHIFESYLGLMEAYYAYFIKKWRIKKPRDVGKLKIRFFIDPEDFYQVTGKSRGTLAYFEPFEFPNFRLQFYYNRLDPKGTQQVILHEFGHYLQKLIDVDFRYSHWPGESLSEYFSTVEWDPKKKNKIELTGAVLDGRLVEIQQDIVDGDYVPLDGMIRGGGNGNYIDYNWGWSLVHFLMNDKRYKKKFESYYLGLARDKAVERDAGSIFKGARIKMVGGTEMLRYFKDEMGLKSDEDLKALQKEWYAHIESLEVTSAQGFYDAAVRARYRGRKQRAKRCFEQAIETGTANAVMYHEYADLLESMDEEDRAKELWIEAVRMDPLVPEFYIEWGKLMIESEDAQEKEEGKRLLRLAHEIEPDNFYLERNLEKLLKK